MAKIDCDVAIVGAGLVGLSLALALRDSGLRTALIDRCELTTLPPCGEWDQRIYAISPGSAKFLHHLGVWSRLPTERIQAVEAMRIFGDVAPHQLNFSAFDMGERALAWIVESTQLQRVLAEQVLSAGSSVWVQAPMAIERVRWTGDHAAIEMRDQSCITTQLVIGADGLHSSIREQSPLAKQPDSYGQTAVVANFRAEKSHHGRAHQWFFADGEVMAWLPLPGNAISLVWSASIAHAQTLLENPDELSKRVADMGQHRLGEFSLMTTPAGFPLYFLRLEKSIAHRLALIGDAAHGIHPLAGQGVNLGFADARVLAQVLRQSAPLGDCGASHILERYAQERREATLAMQLVTDGLARLFQYSHPAVRWMRNRGLSFVDRWSPIKHLLAAGALR